MGSKERQDQDVGTIGGCRGWLLALLELFRPFTGLLVLLGVPNTLFTKPWLSRGAELVPDDSIMKQLALDCVVLLEVRDAADGKDNNNNRNNDNNNNNNNNNNNDNNSNSNIDQLCDVNACLKSPTTTSLSPSLTTQQKLGHALVQFLYPNPLHYSF